MAAGNRMRADAQRNRAALLAAAKKVFGEHGLDAPLDDIAKRAGVGNATLYRRFPDRRELIWEVFADRMADYLRAADHALTRADTWAAFVDYVAYLCELQATDRGISELLTTTIVDVDDRLTRLRELGRERTAEVITRAQTPGGLRPDFTPQDFALLLMANAGVVRRTTTYAPEGWRRQLAFALDGLREAAATAAPPPPSEAAMLAAMRLHRGPADQAAEPPR
ncbi:AcrR family transcriptional regulator [Actinoplanes tereljensis]|uniref:TetR family transcriptional regulator n=1 Tax=Paractinoplanes tereljensis TaxID=571912 RepID=A0A919NZH2_9ACTN|nr:TetR/AcrR family transcriptional regulator [Actinoplanes tereljensis]GIF26786.1 TetR family transcriptional regulator [Actinoplanes tereljensis]